MIDNKMTATLRQDGETKQQRKNIADNSSAIFFGKIDHDTGNIVDVSASKSAH